MNMIISKEEYEDWKDFIEIARKIILDDIEKNFEFGIEFSKKKNLEKHLDKIGFEIFYCEVCQKIISQTKENTHSHNEIELHSDSAKGIPDKCDYANNKNEPCYGEITGEYIGDTWIQYCVGHRKLPTGGIYIPKDPLRQHIFSMQNRRIEKLEAENKMLWEAVAIADNKFKLQEGDTDIELPNERLKVALDYE